VVVLLFFFFFSSRRRHTRWPRDWSSDVCSSDLLARVEYAVLGVAIRSDQGLVGGSVVRRGEDRLGQTGLTSPRGSERRDVRCLRARLLRRTLDDHLLLGLTRLDLVDNLTL